MNRRRTLAVLLVALAAVVLTSGACRFEPEGAAPLEIHVTDKGTGLKSFTATLSQGGTEHKLAAEQFDRAVGEKKIVVALAKDLVSSACTLDDTCALSGDEAIAWENAEAYPAASRASRYRSRTTAAPPISARVGCSR